MKYYPFDVKANLPTVVM